MSTEERLWNDSAEYTRPPAAEPAFSAFEERFGVRLPESFKKLYRVQNGGVLRDVETPEFLLSVGKGENALDELDYVRSIQMWAEAGAMLFEDDLDWIIEEFGDPNLIFPLSSDGHTTYALNYNALSSKGEPSIVYLSCEGGYGETQAPSFEDWIRKLTASSPECAVDWNEHKNYTELYRGSFSHNVTEDGEPELIEHVLCHDGNELLLFCRTEHAGKVKEIERVSLPAGVNSEYLEVSKFRPAPVNSFVLHLEPEDTDDMHWTACRMTSKGTWKTVFSGAGPVYCTVESKDRAELLKLADRLRDEGFSHEPEPIEMSPEIREYIQQFEQVATKLASSGAMANEESERVVPETLPDSHCNPHTMSEEAVVNEVNQILLYFAGQVEKVQRLSDAQKLIGVMGHHEGHYVQLLRGLDLSKNPMKALLFAEAEEFSRKAMVSLKSRCFEAGQLLQNYFHSLFMRALQSN